MEIKIFSFSLRDVAIIHINTKGLFIFEFIFHMDKAPIAGKGLWFMDNYGIFMKLWHPSFNMYMESLKIS
jgi:hypothetical protein